MFSIIESRHTRVTRNFQIFYGRVEVFPGKMSNSLKFTTLDATNFTPGLVSIQMG